MFVIVLYLSKECSEPFKDVLVQTGDLERVLETLVKDEAGQVTKPFILLEEFICIFIYLLIILPATNRIVLIMSPDCAYYYTVNMQEVSTACYASIVNSIKRVGLVF